MPSFKTIQFYCLKMGTVLYLAAICFVVAAIQLKTDASPPETLNENPVTPPAKRKKATHSEPKQLVVEHTGEAWSETGSSSSTGSRPLSSAASKNIWERSVFAVEQIPKSGIFYYEVKIKMKGWRHVFIGLATKQMKLNEGVGPAKNTYAYASKGFIWGHEVKGCEHGVNKRPYINKEIPKFKDGQVVGCGVDLKNGKIFYTLDGEIVIAGLSVNANLPLFPCVTLTNKGQKIEANFGRDFLFKLEKLKN